MQELTQQAIQQQGLGRIAAVQHTQIGIPQAFIGASVLGYDLARQVQEYRDIHPTPYTQAGMHPMQPQRLRHRGAHRPSTWHQVGMAGAQRIYLTSLHQTAATGPYPI